MPGPLLLPLVKAGTDLVNQGFNWLMQNKTNKQQMQFSKEMYAQQRRDALADWSMMNQYNSPVEQMKRFKEAGLNPHLIYGQTNEGATMRGATAPAYNPTAPTADLTAPFEGYYDVRFKEAQLDNMAQQNKLLAAEIPIKTLDAISRMLSNRKSDFDYKLANRLLPNTIETADATLQQLLAGTKKTQADTIYTLDNNQREAIKTTTSIKEALARIVSMEISNAKTKQETSNLRKSLELLRQDERLKELDIQLKKMGIMPSDPLPLRALGRAAEVLKKSPAGRGFIDGLKQSLGIPGKKNAGSTRHLY